MSIDDYERKKQALVQHYGELAATGEASIRLNKRTSNLFRDRQASPKHRLNVRDFNHVINVDVHKLTCEVEGMTTFEDLVNATLAHGLLPLVVPELKTITIGGAVSGMAIESSSFRYGLVHEGVLAMEVLLGSGEVVLATPNNEHKDLFYGLPNSYGTLGYVLKLTIKLRLAAPFVRLQHVGFDTAADFLGEMKTICETGKYKGKAVDFVDGVVFSPTEHYLTLGFDSLKAPYTSDYTNKQIYYKSLQSRHEDYLTTYDYIWRWDTDWFWCSKNVYADRWLVRRLLGKKRLGSRTYSRLMALEQKHHTVERMSRLLGTYKTMEPVIQDIEVAAEQGEAFLKQFHQQIGIKPVWVCPTKATSKSWPYPLYPMDPKKLYFNFGFWDGVPTNKDPAEGYYNRKVEDLVESLGGMKSLYSTSYYARARFEKLYNYSAYAKLKATYDPSSRLKDLYEKTVQRA
jgi:FAD/FMN-containing dehydrogenase